MKTPRWTNKIVGILLCLTLMLLGLWIPFPLSGLSSSLSESRQGA